MSLDYLHGKRWKGYVAAWHHDLQRVVLVELTREAVRVAIQSGTFGTASLRGIWFVARRAGSSERAPVYLERAIGMVRPDPLPPDVNVQAALLRIWAGESRGGGK